MLTSETVLHRAKQELKEHGMKFYEKSLPNAI